MKTTMEPQEATRPAITKDDSVSHAFEELEPGIILPGAPSLCGLARWSGPSTLSTTRAPSNACDLCEEILRRKKP